MISARRDYLQNAVYGLHPDARARARIQVEIAGVAVDFLTSTLSIQNHCLSYFREYLRDGGRPRLEVFAERLEISGDMPNDVWEDEDPEFAIRGDVAVQRDFAARRLQRFSRSGPEQIVSWVSPENEDALHNLMRWSMTPALLEMDAFLLHGAAVVRDGMGYVFFGQSGAGKSTSVGLIAADDPRVQLLGDDGVIIQAPRDGSIPKVFAAPLGAGYTRLAPPAVSAPILGLYSLQQHESHQIRDMSRSEGVAALLASAMNTLSESSLEERFELAMRFAGSSTGIKRLHFAKDAGFWRLLRDPGSRRLAELQA